MDEIKLIEHPRGKIEDVKNEELDMKEICYVSPKGRIRDAKIK